jgi:hypothetical protein
MKSKRASVGVFPENAFAKTMKRTALFLATWFSLISISYAQTNLIEWQTNWPTGINLNLITNQFQLPNSSAWFCGTSSALVGTSNGNSTNLLAQISASSLTYWTYFAASNTPVSLTPGKTLQVTANFYTVATAAPNTSRGLRIALLYAGTNNGVGQTIVSNGVVTPAGNARQTNYFGYCQVMNFGTAFSIPPLQTVVFTNGLSAANSDAVLSKSGDSVQIGPNGGGTTNDPAFVDNTNYTFVMSITEAATNSFTITTTIYGSTLSNSVAGTPGYISQTVTDTNYCYTNFDTFCLRPAAQSQVATLFTITSFEVQTITMPSASPAITYTVGSGGVLNLSWPSAGFWLQSQTNALAQGIGSNWSDVAGSTAVTNETFQLDASKGAVFFRLSSAP